MKPGALERYRSNQTFRINRKATSNNQMSDTQSQPKYDEPISSDKSLPSLINKVGLIKRQGSVDSSSDKEVSSKDAGPYLMNRTSMSVPKIKNSAIEVKSSSGAIISPPNIHSDISFSGQGAILSSQNQPVQLNTKLSTKE